MRVLDQSKSPTKPIQLLREHWQHLLGLCHFTHDLNPIWETKSLQSHLKALSQDTTQQAMEFSCLSHRFDFLCQAFFQDLKFEVILEEELQLNISLLPQVLLSRRGPAPLLMLLFTTLLEECQI